MTLGSNRSRCPSGQSNVRCSTRHPSFVETGRPPPHRPERRTDCPSKGPKPTPSSLSCPYHPALSSLSSRAIRSPLEVLNMPLPCHDSTRISSLLSAKPASVSPPIGCVATNRHGSGGNFLRLANPPTKRFKVIHRSHDQLDRHKCQRSDPVWCASCNIVSTDVREGVQCAPYPLLCALCGNVGFLEMCPA